MSGDVTLDIFLILFFLAAAGILGAGETAILSAAKSTLEELAAQGRQRARAALRLKDRADDLIAAVQISTTILLVLAAAVAGSDTFFYLQDFFAGVGGGFVQGLSHWFALIAGSLLVACLALVIGSLIPKSLGQKYAFPLSLRSAPGLLLLVRAFRVPQDLLTFSANILLKPFKDSTTFSEPQLSEEAIMTIIEKGAESGVIDQTEHDLIESIFQFSERTAKEILIPRTAVVAIDATARPDEILDFVTQEGYTRLPVYSGSIDNIIGIVYAKDVLSLVQHRDLIILHDIMRPALFVPDSKSISELLREFQRQKIHMAVVVDEFGGTEGIVTLEDILEEIVGEIHDEYDEETKPFEVLDDGSLVVDGLLNVSDFNDLTPYHIPESDDYETVAGFVTKLAGRIPEAEEEYAHDTLRIRVLSVHDRRIERIRFRGAELDAALAKPAAAPQIPAGTEGA